MVMIANKKTIQQIANDLQLFLGDNTETFTHWLVHYDNYEGEGLIIIRSMPHDVNLNQIPPKLTTRYDIAV